MEEHEGKGACTSSIYLIDSVYGIHAGPKFIIVTNGSYLYTTLQQQLCILYNTDQSINGIHIGSRTNELLHNLKVTSLCSSHESSITL